MRYLIALVLFVNTVQAAPVPKAVPKPDSILGRWTYDYGGLMGGTITFYADGTYIAKHDVTKADYWLGRWRIEDGKYIFVEGFYNAATNIFSGFGTENRFTVEKNNAGWKAWSTYGFSITFHQHIAD